MPAKSRPSFVDIYMNLARDLSRRSTCRRLAVGCVITTPDYRQVLVIGYNGNAAGLPNDCDSDEPGKCGCLHAEENAALKFAAGPVPKIVFCTHLPCAMCAKRIINLGGDTIVYYAEDYRLHTAIDLFRARGITAIHVPPLQAPELTRVDGDGARS